MNENETNIILYSTEDGKTKIDIKFKNNTIWLTQKKLAKLYNVSTTTISEHINNIYKDLELKEEETLRNFRNVSNQPIKHYNLAMVIAIGYRIRNIRGIQFRNWSSDKLKEYMIKGFVLDDERLKNPKEVDYFKDLLIRIKDIRSSEARFYQQIKDIYILSVDYDKKSEQAKLFFQTVQNKILFAITGKTASELICSRNNRSIENFGLNTWKLSPDGKITKPDMQIAKNYLNEPELKELNAIVSMFLDYAELQANKKQLMYMKDWEEILNKFLKFNEKELLENAGKLSHEFMIEYIDKQYDKYKIIQKENKNIEEIKELEREIKRIEE